MHTNFTTRPYQPTDAPFLYQLYASTRADEIAVWGWNPTQQELFLQMQFQAQQRHYAAQYPAATHQIIVGDASPVGRILTARTPPEIWLVDIALLPTHRNQGIGTRLIQDLLQEARAASQSVRLHVAKTNLVAMRLYTRLGFTSIADDGMYILMEG